MCGILVFCLGKKMNFTAARQTLSKNFSPGRLSFLSFFPDPQFSSPKMSFTLMFWHLQDSHARAIQTLHVLKIQWQQAPAGGPPRRISSRSVVIVAAASSALGCAAPALSSSGHLQAPWYCTLTLQQPACSAAECCLTGDVLASRGPSRWVPRHCRASHSLLA